MVIQAPNTLYEPLREPQGTLRFILERIGLARFADGNPTGPEFKTPFEPVLNDMVKMIEDRLFYEKERTSLIERCRKVDHKVYLKRQS